MKCTNCNDETAPINSQGHTQICESCETNRIENNVLAFIHRNLHGFNHEDVVNHCIGLFKNPQDIAEAKASLTKVYGAKILEIDSKLHSQISKTRREGGRPKEVANIWDIISILLALDGNQIKSNIIAKDTDKAPLLTDMTMASSTSSLIEKITQLESKFAGFEAKFVENEQLKSKYSEMNEHIKNLNSRMEDMNKKLTDAHATIVVLEEENRRLALELTSRNDTGVVTARRPSSSASSSSSSSSDDDDDSDDSSETVIQSPPSTEGAVGALDDAAAADQNTNQHPLHVQLNARQKHHRNIHVTQQATLIAAQAASMGITPLNAANIGNIAAKDIAQTYTRRTDISDGNHLSYSQVTGAGLVNDQTRNNGYPSLPKNNGFQTINRNRGKRRLNQYQLCNKQVDIGLAAPKPEWHNNQTLVIAGLEKGLLAHKEVIYDKISELASKKINIHHMEILSKVYNHWLTIAIELSPSDYNLLNDQNFWPAGIRIRPFQGHRSWRTNRLSKVDRSNSVRMSWIQN